MKITPLPSLKKLNEPQFWLLSIAAGLIALHLTLTSRAYDTKLLVISAGAWTAASCLVYRKRHSLKLEMGVVSSALGISLIALVLLKSSSLSDYDTFLRISPLVGAIGLGLLASGFRGLKHYWKELTILSFLAIPQGILASFIPLPELMAQFSFFLLQPLGLQLSRQGTFIAGSKGGVEVAFDCSGAELIVFMLELAIIFSLIFPTKRSHAILAMVVAVALSVLVNGGRIAFLAVQAASGNTETLKYWHGGPGTPLFEIVPVFLFGLFCLLLLRQWNPDSGGADGF